VVARVSRHFLTYRAGQAAAGVALGLQTFHVLRVRAYREEKGRPSSLSPTGLLFLHRPARTAKRRNSSSIMHTKSELALAKRAFEDLLGLCAPEEVAAWKPSDEQLAAYIRSADRALRGLKRFESLERRQLMTEGSGGFVSVLPESLLRFVREHIRPRETVIRAAVNYLDPGGEELRALKASLFEAPVWSAKRRILGTFEEGLQQIYFVQDQEPNHDYFQSLVPNTAFEVLQSELIQFQPDEWLDRAQHIRPVRSHKENFQLPSQIRLRLEELYRAYIFGLWLSVLALSRAILEYAIDDNLNKFQIEREWNPGKRKRLSELIEELERPLSRHKDAMSRIRDSGNDYLHPKKTDVSKALLTQRQATARSILVDLIEVVEALYLAAPQR